MKKLLLFLSIVTLTLSLNSCSSDSDGGASLTMKINGANKKFKTVTVKEAGYIYVMGHIGPVDEPTETIEFSFAENETGANTIYYMYYSTATEGYSDVSGFISNISANTASSAKGTFSGPLSDGSDEISITNGSFSVTF